MRRLLAALGSSVVLLPWVTSCTATVGVSDVYMSIDQDGLRKRAKFFTDSLAITCIVELDSGRGDATLEALIRQTSRFDPAKNGNVVADRVVGALDQAIPKGKQKIQIALTKVDPVTGEDKAENAFPTGDYRCEVRIDGKLESSAPFNVDFAPCPTAIILAGTSCLNFYKPLTKCPAFGASSREPGDCTCNEKGVWTCG